MKLFNMKTELTQDFRSIVLDKRPLIDVRAPIEYEKGFFPHSVNLPLLNDEERRLVGICYKEFGNTAAVALGKKLIHPEIQNERVKAWKTFAAMHPDAYLYCFRGGQRSQISQMWLSESGIEMPRLKGGYKAFRNFLIQESERISTEVNTLILGGRTGSGKTILLNQLDNSIDLEGLAHHRGSSFGSFVNPQPSQIEFENSLAYELIHHEEAVHKHLVLEHEGRNIGKIYIPHGILSALREGRLVILQTPLRERIDITFDEYVTQSLLAYEQAYAHEAEEQWFQAVKLGLKRISKRLGSELYIQIQSLLQEAYAHQKNSGELEGHKIWIEILLCRYYDPMYDYQIEKSEMPIVFRGDAQEVKAYMKSQE